MKARNENGEIRIYGKLPSKYKSNLRNIAGGFDKLSTDIHEEEGFFDVEEEVVEEYETQGEIYWDEVQNKFIIPSVSIFEGYTFNQIKKYMVKQILNQLESIIDSYRPLIQTLQDAGETIPQTLIDLRTDILSKRELFITNMKAATTVSNVKSIIAQATTYLNGLSTFDYIENEFGSD